VSDRPDASVGFLQEDEGVQSSSRLAFVVWLVLMATGVVLAGILAAWIKLDPTYYAEYMQALDWLKGAGLVAVVPYVANQIRAGVTGASSDG